MHAMHKLVKLLSFMNRQIQATRWSTRVSGLTTHSHYVISDVICVLADIYIFCMHFTINFRESDEQLVKSATSQDSTMLRYDGNPPEDRSQPNDEKPEALQQYVCHAQE